MDQELIDRMWSHSRRVDAENDRRAREAGFATARDMFRSDLPTNMPAMLFFTGETRDLFLSFHPEDSNANRHCHEFFELLYVCRGEPVGVIDDQEVRLVEGSLCIMNPNAIHYFKKYREATDLVLNIVLPKDIFQKTIFRVMFTDPVLNAFFLRYQLERARQPSFLFLPRLDRDIGPLVVLLMEEYLDRARYSLVVIESLLTLLFSYVLRAYGDTARPGDQALAEISGYIYRNYRTAGLADVAARFSYHPKYLSMLIHRASGQTFRNLVASIKLQNAANCLVFTDDSIERIVERVGYKDKSSFYSRFRTTYGMSPAEYRRRNK